MDLIAFFKRLFSPTRDNCKTADCVAANESFAVISCAASLATATVNAIQIIEHDGDYDCLCKNKATCIDTVIFSCFLIRALCIMSSSNHSAASVFSDEYIDSVITLTKETLSPDVEFYQIFNDRVDFYDRVFAKKAGINNKISAIIEEFEYIIKSDIIAGGFAPFSESSPLPILGIFDDLQCRNEVSTYFQFLLAHVDSSLKKAIKVIQ